MDAEFQELVARGKKTQAEADAMIQLANEVQYSILTKKLVPGASCLSSPLPYITHSFARSLPWMISSGLQ